MVFRNYEKILKMVGSVFRGKKFVILLVVLVGLSIYVVINRDNLFNMPMHQVHTRRDDSKEAADGSDSKGKDVQSYEDNHQGEPTAIPQPTGPARRPTQLSQPTPSNPDEHLNVIDSSSLNTREKRVENDTGWSTDETKLEISSSPETNPPPRKLPGEENDSKDKQRIRLPIKLVPSNDSVIEVSEIKEGKYPLPDKYFETTSNKTQSNGVQIWTKQFWSTKPSLHVENNNDGVLKRLLSDGPDPRIPPFSICPFLGLRGETSSSSGRMNSQVSCIPKRASETVCKNAYIAYEVDAPPLKCDKQGIPNEICSFDNDGTIRCDVSSCGDKYVYLSKVNLDYGIVTKNDAGIFISSNAELEQLLYEYTKSSASDGLNFSFLTCKNKNNSDHSEQLVVFPPPITREPSLEPSLININILVLDSVSRAHFYRSLPKTVDTLRRIVYNPNFNATVLDFELFQSMADYTFHNIRAFMCGKTDFGYKEHQDQHYNIEYLFEAMKSKGYHTLLQEDSCWYDEWGSLFTDNLFQGKRPDTLQRFYSRWKEFSEKVKDYSIDDYGLSHFSCEALQRYNITNQFNRPKKICFGGKVFSEHFIDYVERVFARKQTSRRPIFAYTHLNTGHEISGTRIKQIDQRLSEFFVNMARHENTLTLVFSDHGPKTTPYAFHTIDGRAEIYDSVFFAIVPEKVASFLGHNRTRALITNQKRLMTSLELHHAVMSIGDRQRENTGSTNLEGIFAEISSKRSCSDISMKSAAICKCDGWDKTFPTNHPPFIWLAELALGTLNNRIQEEYMQGTETKGGFGNCQRLIGKQFEKIRRRSIGDKYMVTMDLIVKPELEIFEVQVEYPKNPNKSNNEVTVTHLSRISIYRRFEKCKDNTVNLTVCVCKSRKYRHHHLNRIWIPMNSRKNLLRILTQAKNFGAGVMFSDLHVSCLVMVTRTHSASRTSVFEIVNACSDRSYSVKISGVSRGRAVVSRKIPLSLHVKPLTAHFLFSVYHLAKPYGFKATTSYKTYYDD